VRADPLRLDRSDGAAPGARPAGPRDGQGWRTFLRNHTVWACDFLQTYDIWFRPIFAFFIVDVNVDDRADP
jgi:hypothetical protein